MVDLAARAAERPEFTPRRVLQLPARLAQECYMPDDDLPAVLAAGWHLSPMNRMVDRVPKRAETDWLRLLGDTGIDLDREAALLRYARHFDLDGGELDRLRMLRQFIQGAVIAAAAAGLTPHRMTIPDAVVASLPAGIRVTGMAL